MRQFFPWTISTLTMSLFLLSIFISIDAKILNMYEKAVSYNFDDVRLIVGIETLKIDYRNFVLSMENWLSHLNQ